MIVGPPKAVHPAPLLADPRPPPTEQPRPVDRKPEEPAPPLRPTLQDRIDVCRRLLDLRQV